MKPTSLAPRLVAFILALSLAAPSPAFALRQQPDRSGLEQELRTGLEQAEAVAGWV